MNLKKMWPAAAVSLFALTGLAHAEVSNASPIGDTAQLLATSKGGKNVTSVSAEWLLWGARQDHMSYDAMSTKDFPSSTSNTNTTAQTATAVFRSMETDFTSGFRLGLHTVLGGHDNFDANVIWTHHAAKHSHIVKQKPNENLIFVDSPLVTPFPTVAGPGAGGFANSINKEANSRWHVKTDFLDVQIGRLFRPAQTTHFSFRPHIGVRYVKIEQERNLTLKRSNSGTATNPVAPADATSAVISNQHIQFAGVGLRSGFDGTWSLAKGFSLFANLGLSYIGGEFKVTVKEFQDVVDSNTNLLKSSDMSGKPIADIHVGLMYEKSTTGANEMGLTFRLGWEHTKLWGQNQMLAVDHPATSNVQLNAGNSPTAPILKLQKNGDLLLRGLTASIRIDY